MDRRKRRTVSTEQLQDEEPRPGPFSDTQRTPGHEPNGTAPTLRPPQGTVARRSSSTQTPAVSSARASYPKAAPVSLPQVLPSVRNNQPAQHATPVRNTESSHNYAYVLDGNYDNMNMCNSVYYDG